MVSCLLLLGGGFCTVGGTIRPRWLEGVSDRILRSLGIAERASSHFKDQGCLYGILEVTATQENGTRGNFRAAVAGHVAWPKASSTGHVSSADFAFPKPKHHHYLACIYTSAIYGIKLVTAMLYQGSLRNMICT